MKSELAGERHGYRVFISYSHENEQHVKKIADVLRDQHLDPMWDEDFVGGTGFPEQIKTFIAHAHVFLPLITHESNDRGWVHQEIGYATALRVPVLPIAIGKDPQGIIKDIHAIKLEPDLSDLEKRLRKDFIVDLAEQGIEDNPPLFECAQNNSERAIMMAGYADTIRRLGRFGCVRQKGALSSFHLPRSRPSHEIWKTRYGGKRDDEFYFGLLRRERISLQKHADSCGCKLIIDPSLSFRKWGADARCARVRELIDYLRNAVHDEVYVAINTKQSQQESVTLVGDWFSAVSVSAKMGKGYRQTVFTRHARMVRQQIEEFDEEFGEILDHAGITEADSRQAAIDELENICAVCISKDSSRAKK